VIKTVEILYKKCNVLKKQNNSYSVFINYVKKFVYRYAAVLYENLYVDML